MCSHTFQTRFTFFPHISVIFFSAKFSFWCDRCTIQLNMNIFLHSILFWHSEFCVEPPTVDWLGSVTIHSPKKKLPAELKINHTFVPYGEWVGISTKSNKKLSYNWLCSLRHLVVWHLVQRLRKIRRQFRNRSMVELEMFDHIFLFAKKS